MPKKKNRRKPQTERSGAMPRAQASMQWVVFALLVGLAFGGVMGYFVGSAVSAGDTAITDQYGRSPGHPHYNHNHP